MAPIPTNPPASAPYVQHVQLVETDLGWMAIAGAAGRIARLTFGYTTPQAARAALGPTGPETRIGDWFPELCIRLQRYARGCAEDLCDVPLANCLGGEFRAAVLRACRAVPRGQTTTYAALARRCGRPRAARAVGHFMATNPTPLLVPCHRVLAASGGLGGFSAPGGLATKLRLLQLEGVTIAGAPPRPLCEPISQAVVFE